VILLPIFKTKGMVRRSSVRTHGFNTSILSLNHFKFRQFLQANCAVKGKSVAATDCMCASAAAMCSPVCSARTVLVGTRTPLSISCAMNALDHSKSSSEICTSFTGLQRASRTRAAKVFEKSQTDCGVNLDTISPVVAHNLAAEAVAAPAIVEHNAHETTELREHHRTDNCGNVHILTRDAPVVFGS